MIERRNAASPPAAYSSDELHLSKPVFRAIQSVSIRSADSSTPLFHRKNPMAALLLCITVPTLITTGMDYGQGDTFSATYSGPPAYGAPPFPGIHGHGVDSSLSVTHILINISEPTTSLSV